MNCCFVCDFSPFVNTLRWKYIYVHCTHAHWLHFIFIFHNNLFAVVIMGVWSHSCCLLYYGYLFFIFIYLFILFVSVSFFNQILITRQSIWFACMVCRWNHFPSIWIFRHRPIDGLDVTVPIKWNIKICSYLASKKYSSSKLRQKMIKFSSLIHVIYFDWCGSLPI